LFAWQQRLFDAQGRDASFPYEDAIRAQRERSGTMHGRVRWLRPDPVGRDGVGDEVPRQAASNDIHPVSRWTVLLGLPAYLKLRWFSGVAKMPYVPAA
jgi:glutathione S-transferase